MGLEKVCWLGWEASSLGREQVALPRAPGSKVLEVKAIQSTCVNVGWGLGKGTLRGKPEAWLSWGLRVQVAAGLRF